MQQRFRGQEKYVGLRIDVDSSRGMASGVNNLLNLLGEYGWKGTFFVTVGPESWGRAVRRLFTERGFAGRMFRLNPLRTWGLKTLLRGTVIPSKPVLSCRTELLRIVNEGHELGIHGYDHRWWQDHVMRAHTGRVKGEVEKAVDMMARMGFFHLPWASPGWRICPRILEMLDTYRFPYGSDCRGDGLFYPVIDGRKLGTVQIPVNLPTLDEIYACRHMRGYSASAVLSKYCDRFHFPVFTAHAEIEGIGWRGEFRSILERFQERGYSPVPLKKLFEKARSESPIPDAGIRTCRVKGRAGVVACRDGFSADFLAG
jgi:undecaprenyl phosphate-alpha-L-ara4FN deformylase